jgi:hypothetical protein
MDVVVFGGSIDGRIIGAGFIIMPVKQALDRRDAETMISTSSLLNARM